MRVRRATSRRSSRLLDRLLHAVLDRPPAMPRRRLRLEALEPRHLLAVTLQPIDDQTVLAGAPLHLLLSGTSDLGNPLTYTVQVSNASLENPNLFDPQLSAVIPLDNPGLRIVVSSPGNEIAGTMTFQLFADLVPQTVARITTLVDQGFYDGLIFHRVINDFMIQGGDPEGDGTGGSGLTFDDEFRAELQFTTPGLLAMANSGDDTNDSQFFITVAPTRWLDFDHTIFGFLTSGQSILEQIEQVATGENDRPLHDVVMTSVSLLSDDPNGVLRLAVPHGTTGTAEVTVTATDPLTSESASVSFLVTVAADQNNNRPFLESLEPLVTAAGVPLAFQVPAFDVEGDAMYFVGISMDPALSLSIDSATGQAIITPAAGAYGVYSIVLGVSTSPATQYDTQWVPVYVRPSAPAAPVLLPDFDTGLSNSDGITRLNNAPDKTLQFQVDGVIPSAVVELLADGVVIGQALALGDSVLVVTDESQVLADGTYAFTARQRLVEQPVSVGNLQTTVDLQGDAGAGTAVTIDTTAPEVTSTPPATARQLTEYSYVVTTGEPAGQAVFELVEGPEGMTLDPASGAILWTPTTSQGPTEHVAVEAFDAAGNSVVHAFDITVLTPNNAPELAAAAPVLGQTDEDNAMVVALADFINAGTGSTIITDADASDPLGGIAVVATTGRGVWEYSLDGVVFEVIESVSYASALLLPPGAQLRYTPDRANGESASITYAAWDQTTGAAGGRIDATARGGNGALSQLVDMGWLAVTDLNDAPVLAPVAPLLGATTGQSAVTITLDQFINQGLGTTTITDVDSGAVVGGLALVATTGEGTWQYSLDGVIFDEVGTLSDEFALLLPLGATLRFTPSSGAAGATATVSYRAWDATTGEAGQHADATTTGGTTAFSMAADTGTIRINHAPELAPATPLLGQTDEDNAIVVALTDFINAGEGSTIVADADSGDPLGGVALVATTGRGTWAYSLDGAVFTPVGSLSETAALLLPPSAVLRYTPDGANGETATIVYRAWDGTAGQAGGRADTTGAGGASAFSEQADTGRVDVADVNDAPALEPHDPALGTIDGSTPRTFNLSDLVNAGAGTTIVTDVDAGAVVGGLAVVETTGDGLWQYSLDGSLWLAVGAVSEESALLLPPSAALRYAPTGAQSQTATISYRAWDATTGLAGQRADTTTHGSTTAFSTAIDTASLSVEVAPPVSTGSISGYVYIDNDNDGLRITPAGAPHLAVAQVGILLYRYDSSSGYQLVGSMLTESDGAYAFHGLPAGGYMVVETQPADYLDGRETPGTIAGTGTASAGDNVFWIELAAGDKATEFNFGERGLAPGAISLRSLCARPPSSYWPTPGIAPGGNSSNKSEQYEPVYAASSSGESAPQVAAAMGGGPGALAGALAVTELNYKPYAPSSGETAAGWTQPSQFAFVELRNVSTSTIDLGGVRLDGDVAFDFDAAAITSLAPGQYVLLVENLEAFEARYGAGLPVAGTYQGRLADDGGHIRLVDGSGSVIHDFIYRQSGSWPDEAHGQGSTLELLDPWGDYGDSANWRASFQPGGTPGTGDVAELADLLLASEEDWLTA